jgi:hypothetical protein
LKRKRGILDGDALSFVLNWKLATTFGGTQRVNRCIGANGTRGSKFPSFRRTVVKMAALLLLAVDQ